MYPIKRSVIVTIIIVTKNVRKKSIMNNLSINIYSFMALILVLKFTEQCESWLSLACISSYVSDSVPIISPLSFCESVIMPSLVQLMVRNPSLVLT